MISFRDTGYRTLSHYDTDQRLLKRGKGFRILVITRAIIVRCTVCGGNSKTELLTKLKYDFMVEIKNGIIFGAICFLLTRTLRRLTHGVLGNPRAGRRREGWSSRLLRTDC